MLLPFRTVTMRLHVHAAERYGQVEGAKTYERNEFRWIK